MESVSLILIVVGAVIIGVVFLLRLGLRRRGTEKSTMAPRDGVDIRMDEPDFDPLFAINAKNEELSDGNLSDMGRIVADQDQAQAAPPSSPQSVTVDNPTPQAPPKSAAKRRPPRVAEDPHRVVVLNVMAREEEGQTFSGGAVRKAVQGAGFEYGDWQIFHYYSPTDSDAPPLFSLANMVKPGSFDLKEMDAMNTAGLSLFMVPAGEEDDTATFNTMLTTTRRLAAELGGEVRDARRSVLTRQAIGLIREQLNEWRCKARVAQH